MKEWKSESDGQVEKCFKLIYDCKENEAEETNRRNPTSANVRIIDGRQSLLTTAQGKGQRNDSSPATVVLPNEQTILRRFLVFVQFGVHSRIACHPLSFHKPVLGVDGRNNTHCSLRIQRPGIPVGLYIGLIGWNASREESCCWAILVG
jgi:hypothetical protein